MPDWQVLCVQSKTFFYSPNWHLIFFRSWMTYIMMESSPLRKPSLSIQLTFSTDHMKPSSGFGELWGDKRIQNRERDEVWGRRLGWSFETGKCICLTLSVPQCSICTCPSNPYLFETLSTLSTPGIKAREPAEKEEDPSILLWSHTHTHIHSMENILLVWIQPFPWTNEVVFSIADALSGCVLTEAVAPG